MSSLLLWEHLPDKSQVYSTGLGGPKTKHHFSFLEKDPTRSTEVTSVASDTLLLATRGRSPSKSKFMRRTWSFWMQTISSLLLGARTFSGDGLSEMVPWRSWQALSLTTSGNLGRLPRLSGAPFPHYLSCCLWQVPKHPTISMVLHRPYSGPLSHTIFLRPYPFPSRF